jgi:hypothetical protein
VRELAGESGEAIAQYMLSVMNDEQARTADRLEAAKWLADRGFGKALQALDIDVNQYPSSSPRSPTRTWTRCSRSSIDTCRMQPNWRRPGRFT